MLAEFIIDFVFHVRHTKLLSFPFSTPPSFGQSLKRKWQGTTGMPLPKKLRTSDPIESAIVATERNSSKKEQCAMVVEKDKVVEVEAQNLKLGNMTVVNQSSEVVLAQPMTTVPLHPDDEIDIDNMTVNDLRKELRKRQLGTAGRKAELQARLREHLAEESKQLDDAWTSKHSAVATSTNSDQMKVSNHSENDGVNRKNVNEMDIMENAYETTANNKVVIDEPAKTNTSTANSKVIDALAESDAMTKEVSKPMNGYVKQQAPKSALKPSKYNPSVIEKPSSSAAMPTKVSDSSTNSINRPTVASDPISKGTQLQSSSITKVPSSLALKTPGGTSFKSAKAGGPGSAILFEKKIAHSAATEARKARLAEMRQKVSAILSILFPFSVTSPNSLAFFIQLVQPNAATVGSSTEPSSHSKYAVVSTLKKMPSSSALGESKSSILTKMREKAAAEKNENVLNAPPSKSAGTMEHTSSTSVNRVQLQTSSQPATAQGSMALKSILDPANKPIVAEPIKMPSPKKNDEKPLSPMQTYEMSDREEESDSESESDDDGNQRPKKVVSNTNLWQLILLFVAHI